MPVNEHEFQKPKCAKYSGNFELIHGYWQFLVYPDDQKIQSLITPDGIFTPRRLLHGNVNANRHLQTSLMRDIPEHLSKRLLLLVDDMVIPAKSNDELLTLTAVRLDVFVRLNINLNPGKYHLYRPKIVLCGRELSEKGMRYEPRQLNTLEYMRSPSLPSELLHFTGSMQWMLKSIPNFTSLIRPFLLALDRAYALTLNMRTKQSIKRITLEQIK